MRKSILTREKATMNNFNICKSNTVLIIVIVATSLTEVITLRRAEVLVNESIFINCVSNEVRSIQWHHTPHGKKSYEYVYAGGRFYSPYNKGRFWVENDLTTNVYTLTITNVTHEDAGLYECKDDVLSGVFGSTHLTVLDSSPVCTSNINPNGFAGPNTCNIEQENMTFSCAVSFSGNSPDLMWSTLNGSQSLNSPVCESKDNRINCSLSMKADPSFDGSTFICQTTASNDARYKCSIGDIRVEYFFGGHEDAEKKVDESVTCVVKSNLQIHYNWTIQQNNQDNIFSTNRTIYLQKSGFYKCSVKYNIRNVTCYAPIVTVNVSNIVDDKSGNVSIKQSNDLTIGISILGTLVAIAVTEVIAFFMYRMYIKAHRTSPNSECRLQVVQGTTQDYELPLVPQESSGAVLAYAYYFDYLQIVIPGVWNSFVKEIQRPSAVKEPTEKKFLFKKMLILIPKTLLSPMKLTDDTNIRRTNLSIKQCFHRSGKENRDYTMPIYELTDKKSGNVYYFVTDIPSCLYAIREAYDSELSIMSRDDVYETRNDFVLTLKALLNHPKNHSQFANLWELLLWPDDDDETDRMKLSDFVSQEINSKELAVKLAEVLKQPIASKPTPVSAYGPISKRKQTFEYAGGISAYPMYSERPRYALKNCLRGFCIIINNFDFPGWEPRSGAITEIDGLKKLFEGLKFKVDAKENLTADEMANCLIEYRDRDHSGSDAFVCCLLSHGERGCINATDKQIPATQLMELFYERSCPGLAGKPKLFFIGTCQGKGEYEKYEIMPSASAQSNPPDSDGQLLPERHDMQYEDRTNNVRELAQPGAGANDFIVSYACLPETIAWHDSKQGGLYVQALCKHLNQDLEIDVALRYVNQEVRDLLNTYDKEGEKYSRQDPFHIIMPPQKFLFLGSL